MALPPTKPLERPSSFLVPLTPLLGVPVPVAAQWVPSIFLSSPRLLFFFFLNLFKAISFFSLFPLLSRDPPREHCPVEPPHPDGPSGHSLPASGGLAAAQRRRLLDKGRGYWGEGSVTAAVPAARTPPPLAGPTLFRTAGCACWVGARTLFLRPLSCGKGPRWLLSGLADAEPVTRPFPAPPFLLLPAEVPVWGNQS